MNDWMRDQELKKLLPPNKEMIHRDAVEILLTQAYELGRKRNGRDKAEEDRERTHGPMFI